MKVRFLWEKENQTLEGRAGNAILENELTIKVDPEVGATGETGYSY